MSSENPRWLLIVERDSAICEMLKMNFDSLGYKTETASTYQEAIEAAVRTVPSLIILSTELEDGDPIILFQELRRRAFTANIPVIFIGPNDIGIQNAILEAGVDDFVAKPFDMDILALRVRNAIQRSERDGLTDPRSHLPTGRLVTEKVRETSTDFDWSMIQIKLEGFEAFRSVKGFMQTDEILAFTARILREQIAEHGTTSDFVGHQTDDRFLVITDYEHGPKLAPAIETAFNEGIKAFYNFFEAEQGYIEVENDFGEIEQVPLMTMTTSLRQEEPL